MSDEIVVSKSSLRRLLEARELKETLETQLETAKSDLNEIELDVWESFEEQGIEDTLKVDLGEPWGVVAFRTRETIYAKIVDEDEVMGYYVKKHRLEDVSQPKIVMKRLNEDVRGALETHQSLPPGTTYTTSRGMTITRQKD